MKIKVSVSTNKVGSKTVETFEIDDLEWDYADESEKEALAMDCMCNLIEWNWEEVE